MKTCEECKYCFQRDYGYSNWTVEGVIINCLLKMNPGFPKDRFYGGDPALLFAEQCSRFVRGEPVDVDVEQEEGPLENYSQDPEIKELLRGWEDEG
jgi:hypothetical protein